MTLNVTEYRSFSTVKRCYGSVDCHAVEVTIPLHCLGPPVDNSVVSSHCGGTH